MSEWIKNTSTNSIWPDDVVATTWLEVMYEDGTTDKGQAHGWGYSWNTCHRDHITQYRILATEQTPTKVGEAREPSGGEPNKEQVGGDHYKSLSIQPWDAMEVWLTPEQFQGYLLGSGIKYLGRYNADKQGKGGMEDVKKAIHFLNKLVQVKGGE